MADMERIMGTLEGELSAPATLDAALTLEHIVAPIPEGYIKPEGTIAITENGTVDVTEYAEAAVDVPIPEIVPLEVTANGTYTAPEGTAYSPITVDVQEVEPQPPTDGKTHIWIEIDENTPANRLKFTLYFGQTVANGVRVDWGDGSDPQTYAGTGAANHEHTYTRGGEYEITLEVLSGTIQFSGSAYSYGSSIYGTRSKCYREKYWIRRVAFDSSVTEIGMYTFYECFGLTMVHIPDSVKRIGQNAFYYCQNMRSLTLPGSVESIEDYALYGCYGLMSLTIQDGVKSIGAYAFQACYTLPSVCLPDSVNTCGNYVFYGDKLLREVTLSNNMARIENNMFGNCDGLAYVTIPDGVTSIGASAFYQCRGLTAINIPKNVTSIEAKAFQYCYSLGRIRFEPTTPPTVANKNAFEGIPTDCVISVPVGTLVAYTTAANYPSASTYTYVEE